MCPRAAKQTRLSPPTRGVNQRYLFADKSAVLVPAHARREQRMAYAAPFPALAASLCAPWTAELFGA